MDEQMELQFENASPAKLVQITRQPPSDITFYHNHEPFLVMHSDGRITIGSQVKADEAAQIFLDTLSKVFPQWLRTIKESA